MPDRLERPGGSRRRPGSRCLESPAPPARIAPPPPAGIAPPQPGFAPPRRLESPSLPPIASNKVDLVTGMERGEYLIFRLTWAIHIRGDGKVIDLGQIAKMIPQRIGLAVCFSEKMQLMLLNSFPFIHPVELLSSSSGFGRRSAGAGMNEEAEPSGSFAPVLILLVLIFWGTGGRGERGKRGGAAAAASSSSSTATPSVAVASCAATTTSCVVPSHWPGGQVQQLELCRFPRPVDSVDDEVMARSYLLRPFHPLSSCLVEEVHDFNTFSKEELQELRKYILKIDLSVDTWKPICDPSVLRCMSWNYFCLFDQF
ncbi:uncharacterized protein LOC124663321 [Lolium rigidum]|uniref:uncharacterized protein LOC124663321 n=1 Tax=Lolium rigidum TaxID=89674 RepID=UPI001F5E083D|nr:uncharacterized protein LOC124663321 [Lolium rigidum]